MAMISVVGIGAGNAYDMTFRADQAIRNSDVLVGYSTYIELIRERYIEKEVLSTGMTKEVERCNKVLELALQGKNVALISSGDSGIYGMAGLMLEVIANHKKQSNAPNHNLHDSIEIQIVPGVTALSLAAAKLGAPIMHDFAVISLSDLLTPLDLIKKRIECAAKGDFVICIYNPRSKKRIDYMEYARDIILQERKENTPVGIVRNAARDNEEIVITTLADMLKYEIDMFCTILVGNSSTKIQDGKIITPRGYDV